MVLWTTWNISQDNPDLPDFLAMTDLSVHPDKKVNEDTMVTRETEALTVYRVKWDLWACLDQLESLVHTVPMVLPAFQDKWARWVQVAKKENVVIKVLWAIMALKAKKVTQGIREEGAEQDPRDHPDAWWALTGSRFPIVTPLKNETLMTTTIFKESTN